MSSQDRSYYRDSQYHRTSSLVRFMGGSVPLFSAGGLSVRIHAAVMLVTMIYLGAGAAQSELLRRVLVVGALLALALLHESAHCLSAILLGGNAEEILLWPLGGLSDPRPPRRFLPVLITSLSGPVANGIVCASSWLALHLLFHAAPTMLNPFALTLPATVWSDPRFYLLITFDLSYLMLVLNLLPVMPLDGGRVLQCALWPFMGYGRALRSACNIGILLAITIALAALAAESWLLCLVMVSCLIITVHRLVSVDAAGLGSPVDLEGGPRRPRRHLNRLAKWRARRQIRREEAESIRVDEILTKVYHSGMRSLSWSERRLLRRATARQRECAMEETFRR